MKKLVTRFGEIEYSKENSLHFPQGLVGFENLHDFVVMPNEKNGPLFWIQSVEDPEIAFVLTDPTNFFLDYKVVPNEMEMETLNIKDAEDCHALSVVTVPESKEISLNLAAPIIFAPGTNRAIQVILENTQYQIRTPLPKVEEMKPAKTKKAKKKQAQPGASN
ncbi:MAG: flagellar assembly protein FliW [Desulfobulbaceae bacterium]|nr:flagellar assembly protein FliW [Desulfobulbaceae bacterium]